MDPNVSEMKYADLKKYAKSLGIEINAKLKKEVIIDMIQAHFEALKESEPVAAEPEKTKKAKKSKVSKKTTETKEETVETNEQPPTKTKKTTKKVKKENRVEVETPVVEAVPEIVVTAPEPVIEKKVKKTKKTTSAKSSENNEAEKEVKKAKKTKKKSTESEQKVAEQENAIKKKKKLVKVKKPVEKREESKVEQEIEEAAAQEEQPAEIVQEEEQSEEKQENMNHSRRLSTRKSTRVSTRISMHQTNNEEQQGSIMTNDDSQTSLNFTNDILNATFDKSVNTNPLLAEHQVIPHREGVDPTVPLSTTLGCPSFYHNNRTQPVQDMNETMDLPSHEEQPTATAAPVIDSFQQVEAEAKKEEPVVAVVAAKPKPAGGARITRPTQEVKIIKQTVLGDNKVVEEVRTQKVEVIQREAGPRITKPVIIEQQESGKKNENSIKKKLVDSAMNRVNKVKEALTSSEKKKPQQPDQPKSSATLIKAKPVPDFKALHEKEANKMESIDVWKNRKDNQKQFGSMRTTPQHQSSLASTTQNSETKKSGFVLTKQSSLLLPKPNVGRSSSMMAKNSPFQPAASTPRSDKAPLNLTNQSAQNVEPTTPILDTSNKMSQNKTPQSVNKPKPFTLLKSAIKNSLNTSTSGDSQLSSFQRRKSYDLSLSLSKPLKYKQYTGKLKPVDFSAKSVFLAQLAASNANNNETKIVEKSTTTTNTTTTTITSAIKNVFKPILNLNETSSSSSMKKAASPKNHVELNKKRVSIVGKLASGSHHLSKNALTDQVKSEHLKKENEKSTLLMKKLNLEKMKMKKQQQVDKNRNLSEPNENEVFVSGGGL